MRSLLGLLNNDLEVEFRITQPFTYSLYSVRVCEGSVRNRGLLAPFIGPRR